MSSAEQSSVNQDTIEQTKQQIRGLVGEIVQLSKSELGPEDYYPAILQKIVQALAAVGGAVWVMDEGRSLKLLYQQNLSETLLDSQSDDAIRHLRMLDFVANSNQPQLVPPLSGMADERAGGNPTRYLLVLAPMQNDGAVEGVIEIFQRPDSQPATQRGYLKFVLQMCEQIGEWLKTKKLRHFSDRHSLWAQADHFARLVHDSLDLRETSFTIVNEARRMIGCDRVAIALNRGSKCVVQAISGQDSLDNRSNVVVKLGVLATKVVSAGEPFYYNGATSDMPPQLEEAVHDYVDESYSKSVIVLPLRKPGESLSERDQEVARDGRDSREIIGALIVEQIESDLPRELLAPRIDLVYEHTARAVSNSLDYNNLFLMPVWRTLGKASWVIKSRTLPKTLTITGAVIALLLASWLVPYSFDLSAKGSLQPVVRQEVFVPENGRISEVLVKDGDTVKEGDVLVEMESDELKFQIEKISGDMKETTEQLRSVSNTLLAEPSLTIADRKKLDGEKKRLALHRDTLTKQWQLLEAQRERLKVKSPIDGKVILSWELEKALKSRPVQRGQSLLTVADTSPDSRWELELNMPERRVGHVKSYQKLAKQTDLPVSYILATDPSTKRFGKIKEIHDTTQMHEQEGHTVRIRVELEQKEVPPDPRPGASATAKVRCGTASVGYVFLHEFIEFMQSKVIFSFF